jgi:hypothetical protein
MCIKVEHAPNFVSVERCLSSFSKPIRDRERGEVA